MVEAVMRRKLLQVLGDTKIPFLGPADQGFQHLWESSYSGLVLRQSCSLPTELHGRVQAALRTLRTKGCLLRDLVRIRDRDVFTTVSRALLGQPGHTYRYLDTRLFAIPWHNEEGGEVKGPHCCDADMRAACQALWELNSFFCTDVPRREEGHRLDPFLKAEGLAKVEPAEEGGDAESKHSGDSKHSDGGDSESRPSEEGGTGESKHSDEWDLESKHSSEQEEDLLPQGAQGPSQEPSTGSQLSQFNVTLLNFMDPATIKHLKEEPYYGMGKMAVGWHHDENLIAQSPVAVYSYGCHSDTSEGGEGASKDVSSWRIGLKVAWDIYTPGLTLPLQSGDCYYMKEQYPLAPPTPRVEKCLLAPPTPRVEQYPLAPPTPRVEQSR
ncbi:hypothetical protein NHX12_006225 [Muraenolepis orangiensis]|uniref:Alpha-ketoglutarate-dependent dioxygenase FTO catalytic domain-containing protein n=1 Tax=Muraenolepis orangiensis TaxID=630683 RepID=A0A9Q0IB19_9TELE|nr:hypothetical protein NHX12_006225 [Muraenolepis orangiensis]